MRDFRSIFLLRALYRLAARLHVPVVSINDGSDDELPSWIQPGSLRGWTRDAHCGPHVMLVNERCFGFKVGDLLLKVCTSVLVILLS